MAAEPINPPASRPCASCPYRQDAPSGLWDASEYAKLPDYDKDTAYQPYGVFMCHQRDGSMCAGWCAVHDMAESLAIRFAAMTGALDSDALDAVHAYETDVPVFASGAEAAAHGLRDVESPGDRAQRAMLKLQRQRAGRG